MPSIVEQAPQSKIERPPLKKTRHLYHACQDHQAVRVSLCGLPRSTGKQVALPATLPSETCVVCIDLVAELRSTGCSLCGMH